MLFTVFEGSRHKQGHVINIVTLSSRKLEGMDELGSLLLQSHVAHPLVVFIRSLMDDRTSMGWGGGVNDALEDSESAPTDISVFRSRTG